MLRTAFISAILLAMVYGLWILNETPTRTTVVSTAKPVKTSVPVPTPALKRAKPERRPTKDAQAQAEAPMDNHKPVRVKQPDVQVQSPSVDAPQPALDAVAEGDNEPDEVPLRWSTDVDGIREAMRALLPKVKECYESWLKAAGDDDDISGRVVLRMTIGAEPDEASARMRNTTIVHNDLDHEFMTGCIVNLTEGLRFEIPDEPLELKFPFVFKADPEE